MEVCELGRRDLSRIVAQIAIYGYVPRVPDECINNLIEVARANRVGLEVSTRIGMGDPVEFGKLIRATKLLSEVVNIFKGLRYAVYKLSKPVLYGPVDIDILIDRRSIGEAVKRLRDRGFRIVSIDPYSITMARGRDVVDLYTHPSTGWLVFMDGDKLLEHVETRYFNGVEAPMIIEPAEAVVTASHAVYKEMIININDVATVVKWGGRRAEDIAEEHNVLEALLYIYRISRGILMGDVDTPYRIPITVYISLLAMKIHRDSISRSLIAKHLTSLFSRRYIEIIMNKLTRESY